MQQQQKTIPTINVEQTMLQNNSQVLKLAETEQNRTPGAFLSLLYTDITHTSTKSYNYETIISQFNKRIHLSVCD